jgi:arylsulfatase A-like enzyme/Flp pilus assembly protein TadD
VAAAVALVATVRCGSDSVRVPERSNVLLITVDTLRGDALGWIGGTNETPALDGLAGEGLRFRTAVTPTPLTLPAHASLLTGLYPDRHGVRDNGQVLAASGSPTLAERLRAAGYHTAAFVSGYPLQAMFGLDRGFDHYDDDLPGADQQWLERPADQTTRAALDWIREAGSPWFVWIHYYDPHAPYEPPREFWQPGRRGAYDGEVAFADDAIGHLLAGLPEAAAATTLTVFTADHGEAFGEHDEVDHGLFLYDTTVTVPMVFHFPGVLSPGESEANPRLVDVFPTLLDLFGLEPTPDLDGRSLSRVLAGGNDDERVGYLETRYPWHTFGWAPLRAIRTDRWKLVDAPRRELYDLQEDPGELENLHDRRPDVAASLLETLDAYAAEVAAPSESVNDPEVLSKLEALGYVSSGGAGGEPPEDLPDPKDRRTERRLLLAGENRFLAGDWAGALQIFEEVLFTDPDNPFALLRSGLALLRDGRAEEAITWLERAVAADPDQPEARYGLADALTRVGRYDEAVPQWQETIRLQPRRAAAWANLGSALTWAGRPDDGLEAFLEATAIEPGRADLWTNLAAAERAAGRLDDAIAHLAKAAELEGEAFAFSARLGRYLAEAGRTDEAVTWLSRSRPGEPEYAEGRLALAAIESRRGDAAAARTALEEALRVAPGLRDAARADPALAPLLR